MLSEAKHLARQGETLRGAKGASLRVTSRKLSLTAICDQLGLSRAKFYRWQTRQEDGQLADQVVVPRRHAVPPRRWK